MQPIKLLLAVALGSKDKADSIFNRAKRPKPKAKKKAPSMRVQFPKEYKAYVNAIQRCTNPKNPMWKWYGGRGIKMKFKSFEEFLKDIGPCPDPAFTLDRAPKNHGHYAPGNVQWATRSAQALSRRPKRDKAIDKEW
jgi:hypothetical protein